MELTALQLEEENTSRGYLRIQVVSAETNFPIADARISLSGEAVDEMSEEELTTDVSGQTPDISLAAPPEYLSEDPNATEIPYAEYSISVSAEGFESTTVQGMEIFAGQLALQEVRMNPAVFGPSINITIPDHTLVGDYPAKIPEDAIKPIDDRGEVVLSRVVIPEIIVVHDGVPSNSSATNYYVPYRDYIKNVACCEIYTTWPRETLIANILVIQSFTMNRVYTEWYRNI